MSTQVEIWRVSTVEGVFETDLETLKQWIAEGCVLPTDKVTKGNLNWIEAGKAPMLRTAFSGEARTVEPVTPTTTSPEVKEPHWQDHDLHNEQNEFVDAPADSLSPESPAAVCHDHPERKTEYVCQACVKSFCKDCVKTMSGGKITLCPVCGDLCKRFEQEQIKVTRQEFQSSGFGFSDFSRALRYPFQHKLALLFGAALYAILLFGGFRGRVLASVILFGCISQVISQVAWGRLNRSFMPELGSFSAWDDLFVPLGLGIGVTIITWGPAIILMLVLVFGAVGGAALPPSSGIQAQEDSASQLSSDDVDVLLDPNETDPKKIEQANQKLQQLRPGHQISHEAEKSQMELNDPTADLRFFASYFQGSIFIVLLLLVSVVWGIFYYPMALAVAGFTESFGSVINPLVGLDTIRRMGGTYFKAFGMVLLIQVAGFIVSIITAIITAPFALPFFGNLPAMFIDGSMTFYFNLVIACILGLALHKCADRVGIELT